MAKKKNKKKNKKKKRRENVSRGTMLELIIRGGLVLPEVLSPAHAANTALVPVDIGVDASGCIEAIEPAGSGRLHSSARARHVIDAHGLVVTPGGVDSHCHIEQRTSTGLVPCDDFRQAGICALAGGTTTIIPFACQHRGQRIQTVVDAYRACVDARAVCDVAVHIIVTDPSVAHCIEDLTALHAEGYTSVKVYLTYDALKLDDKQLLDVLAACRRLGSMAMVHAESDAMVSWITRRLLEADRTAPHYHAAARPPLAEREATHRAVSFAEYIDTPLLVVHVSGEAAVEEIARAQTRGAPIFAETCPQYLFLTQDALFSDEACGSHAGMKYLCSPPLRDQASINALWSALRSGAVQVVSSDHSAYRFSPDPHDATRVSKQHFGQDAPFSRVPMGLPGLETRMALLYSEGVMKKVCGAGSSSSSVSVGASESGGGTDVGAAAFDKRVRNASSMEEPHQLRQQQQQQQGKDCDNDRRRLGATEVEALRRFVEVTCENPARLYGLYPRKGVLCIGSHADIALWRRDVRWTMQHCNLHDSLDYSPFEGLELCGNLEGTVLRGRLVCWRGEMLLPGGDLTSTDTGSSGGGAGAGAGIGAGAGAGAGEEEKEGGGGGGKRIYSGGFVPCGRPDPSLGGHWKGSELWPDEACPVLAKADALEVQLKEGADSNKTAAAARSTTAPLAKRSRGTAI
eukprot:UC1_evm3s1859